MAQEEPPGPPAPRRAWAPREVAKLLGLSKSTVYLSIQRGELRARRWGRRWVVPDDALDEFLGANRDAQDEEPDERPQEEANPGPLGELPGQGSGNGFDPSSHDGSARGETAALSEGRGPDESAASGMALPARAKRRDRMTVEWAIDVLDHVLQPFSPAERAIILRFVQQDVEAHDLTSKEAAMLLLVARGLTQQEMAQQLGVSVGSVKSYVARAYRAVGVSSRVDAVRFVYEHEDALQRLAQARFRRRPGGAEPR